VCHRLQSAAGIPHAPSAPEEIALDELDGNYGKPTAVDAVRALSAIEALVDCEQDRDVLDSAFELATHVPKLEHSARLDDVLTILDGSGDPCHRGLIRGKVR
jgi:hypothetical protein